MIKRIMLLILCAMVLTHSFAQTENQEHLTFMGIPIDGSPKSFVKQLKKKGFKYYSKTGNTPIMKGTFAGCSDTEIFVKPNRLDLVYMVSAKFSIQDNWASLSQRYFHLKEMLSAKYGKPYKCIEIFDVDSQPTNDAMKFLYLQNDLCKYETVFKMPNRSMIELNINYVHGDGFESFCCVDIVYIDFVNWYSDYKSGVNDL